MGGVWYGVRTRLRSERWSLVAIVLLVGLSGGVVMTTVAAARRTSSAFDRLVDANAISTALVTPDKGNESELTTSELRALPDVERVGRIDFAVLLPGGRITTAQQVWEAPPLMIVQDGVGYATDRFKIDSGRMPDQSKPDEVFVERWYADAHDLRVGSTLDLKAVSAEDLPQVRQAGDAPDPNAVLNSVGTPIRFRVVGIGGGAQSIAINEEDQPVPLVGTRAFWTKFGHPSAEWWGAMVTMRPDATAEQLRRQVEGLHPEEAFAVQSVDATRTQVDRAVEPQVVALWVFAAIASFVALLVVGQAIARRLAEDGMDNPLLDAIGMTRRDREVASMTVVSIVGMAGGVVAVIVSILLSPIAPIGPARLAEPAPGFAADWWVLALGAVGVVLFTCLLGIWPVIRTSRVLRGSSESRPSHVAASLAGAGASVATITGVRFALESGSRGRSIPARSTLIAATTAVGVVVAVVTFAASLDHLVTTPRLFGFPGDYVVGVGGGSSEESLHATKAAIDENLLRLTGVKAFSWLLVSELRIDDRTLPAVAYQPGSRPVQPAVHEGRVPSNDHEVALGSSTMRAMGLRLGDTVRLGSAGAPATIVGATVLPNVGASPVADKAGLGEGLLVTPHALDELGSSFDPNTFAAVVETDPGMSLTSLRTAVDAISVPDDSSIVAARVPEPSDIAALRRLRSTPVALASLLVLLIAATVVHALLLAIRRRRRDVAILQCVGMRPGQVMLATAWQATTIALVAIVVGIPLGIIAGRWSWMVLARLLGVIEDPVVPALVIAGAAIAVLVMANLVGLFPGWRLAHRRPAPALRAE